jgi:hypothetical protein
MPTENKQSQSPSPFEIVTPGKSKKGSMKSVIIALVVVLFLALGIFVGVILVRQNQDVRERAGTGNLCPAAQECPSSQNPGLLRSCDGKQSDGSPEESLCQYNKGIIKTCGGRQYCCPKAGGNWSTNLTLCANASPTATPTSTATASPTAAPTSSGSPTKTASPTATPTKTGSATPTATGTKAPIPQTGTEWPTYLGVGIGAFVIIGSILLAI